MTPLGGMVVGGSRNDSGSMIRSETKERTHQAGTCKFHPRPFILNPVSYMPPTGFHFEVNRSRLFAIVVTPKNIRPLLQPICSSSRSFAAAAEADIDKTNLLNLSQGSSTSSWTKDLIQSSKAGKPSYNSVQHLTCPPLNEWTLVVR